MDEFEVCLTFFVNRVAPYYEFDAATMPRNNKIKFQNTKYSKQNSYLSALLAIIDDVANTHKKNRILNKNTKIVKTKLDSFN